MPIRVLSQEVIHKIAAGEVVERPASVVKELVENALDASASQIRVRLTSGGLGEIFVFDNGCGIPRAEVGLAFQRHATSKLSSLEDLERIHTLGFRGEALASIAAIADVTLVTCHAGEDVGNRVRFAFGEKQEERMEATGTGTTVWVRDLFANLPARRKFLRKPRTEAQHASNLVSRYAIAHADVGFSMEVEGRQVLHTLGGSLLASLRRVHVSQLQ